MAASQTAAPRVAVVTGGARRLGRHLCLRLAADGWQVVCLYRASAAEAASLQQEVSAAGGALRTLAVDIADKQAVAGAFADVAAREGGISLLVNNVGNYNPQDVTQLDPEVWDATIATNLSGAFYCAYHALPLMAAGGQIINIGMAGLDGLRANRRGADYHVSKAGLLSLTRSLAAGWGARGIRVNMVSPGQLENSIDLPEADALRALIPLGRAGTLDDIWQAVAYLLAATYVTGANIDVAGGYRL